MCNSWGIYICMYICTHVYTLPESPPKDGWIGREPRVMFFVGSKRSLFPIPVAWYSAVMVLQSPWPSGNDWHTVFFPFKIVIFHSYVSYHPVRLSCLMVHYWRFVAYFYTCCGCLQHFHRSNLPYAWTTDSWCFLPSRYHFLRWIIENRNFLNL